MSREGTQAGGGMQGHAPVQGSDQQRGFTRGEK